MGPLLGRALPGAQLQEVRVLNHKPGRRCTLLYTVCIAGQTRRLTGKWYREARLAGRLFRLLSDLIQAPETNGVALGLAPPLACDPEQGVVLLEYADGHHLRELVPAGDTRPFAVAGEWLAALHSLPAVPGLKMKPLPHELAKARSWAGEVALGLPEQAGALDQTCASLGAAASSWRAGRVVIHRDYYPGNLLWDGQRLRVLDFDQMALGDAAVDVGSFLAQLEKLRLRPGFSGDQVEASGRAFLDAYTSRGPGLEPERLSFFLAYTFLKLAAAEVKRKRPDWQWLTGEFVQRARQEAASARRS